VRCRRAPGFMRFDCFTLPPRHAIFAVCPLKSPQHANVLRPSNNWPASILSLPLSPHRWNKVVLPTPTFFRASWMRKNQYSANTRQSAQLRTWAHPAPLRELFRMPGHLKWFFSRCHRNRRCLKHVGGQYSSDKR